MKKKIETPATGTPHPDPLPIAPPTSQRGEGGNAVDAAGVQQAKHEMENAAKKLGKAAKEASEAALQLQLAGADGQPDFEEALLLPKEQLVKRYTAGQAEKLEWRRDGALLMLAYKIPKEHIAATLRMNVRTLDALIVSQAAKYAQFTEDYAKRLLSHAGAAMEMAMTKMADANFLQLTTGAGIMVDKAMVIKGGVPASSGEEPVIDVTAEDEDVKKFREGLKNLKSANPKIIQEKKL